MITQPTIHQRVQAFDHVLSWCGDGHRFDTLAHLLADAIHWCDAYGENFAYALAIAGKGYLDHLNDQQPEERNNP